MKDLELNGSKNFLNLTSFKLEMHKSRAAGSLRN